MQQLMNVPYANQWNCLLLCHRMFSVTQVEERENVLSCLNLTEELIKKGTENNNDNNSFDIKHYVKKISELSLQHSSALEWDLWRRKTASPDRFTKAGKCLSHGLLYASSFPFKSLILCVGLWLKIDFHSCSSCFVLCYQLCQGRSQRYLKSRPNHRLALLYFHLLMSHSTSHPLLLVSIVSCWPLRSKKHYNC